jgi:hypothetical protein
MRVFRNVDLVPDTGNIFSFVNLLIFTICATHGQVFLAALASSVTLVYCSLAPLVVVVMVKEEINPREYVHSQERAMSL